MVRWHLSHSQSQSQSQSRGRGRDRDRADSANSTERRHGHGNGGRGGYGQGAGGRGERAGGPDGHAEFFPSSPPVGGAGVAASPPGSMAALGQNSEDDAMDGEAME
jgi:hypothetical protein